MQFRKKEEDRFSMDMTPMIDVIFLLLIFFMVSTSFINFFKRMDISLPEAKASVSAEKLENYVIELGLDKKILLNKIEVNIDTLEKKLIEKEPGMDVKKSVIIRADKKLDYGLVVKIMGIVKASNITDLSIAVK
jgi:biopolymer transport protein ExbD